MNWWKGLTALDRWRIVRITHIVDDWRGHGDLDIVKTEFICINQYNGKAKVFRRKNEWLFSDFPENIYVP